MEMKKLLFVMFSLFICASSASAQSLNDKISGKWVNDDQSRVIEFVRNGSVYDAIIIKAEDSTIIGKKQITGLVFTGKDTFQKGVLHIILKNMTVNCKVRIIGDSELEIIVSKGFISKSQIWKRYKEER